MIQGILFIKTNNLFLFFDAQFCNLKLLFFTCKFIRNCKLEYVKKIFAIFYKKKHKFMSTSLIRNSQT